jgi:quinoprotein glucose dehydrogenase
MNNIYNSASNNMKYAFLLLSILAIIGVSCKKQVDWPYYLGGQDRNHYSQLNQITFENIDSLKVAWIYENPDSSQIQTNPLIVDGVLYGVSPYIQAFALDAATGEEIWRTTDLDKAWGSTSRGLAYWEDGQDQRILYTVGHHLWALNAANGRPILSFGDSGKVDLHLGLPKIAKEKFLTSNTPGTVFKDLIIMPVRLSEGEDAAPGDIRAFNIRTGALVWTFHTIPYPGEEGYETFPPSAYLNEEVGAANNWAGMAVDEEHEILYVPTGSAGYDFYGGNRKGQNLYANTLLALDANTGKKIWHYQAVHHDLWDRDFPAPPNLIDITRDGQVIPAVAQISKQGYVFLFNRITGQPLFDIEEIPVPSSTLHGEISWPTQPRPILPLPFARSAHEITTADLNPYSTEPEEILKTFSRIDKEWFAPPSEKGTLILPGFDGGAEWGGAAAHPKKGIIYINSNEMPWIMEMKRKEKLPMVVSRGAQLYQANCASCHLENLKGNPASGYPSLINILDRKEEAFIRDIVVKGKGMMPGFPQLADEDIDDLLDFLDKDSNVSKEPLTAEEVSTSIEYRMQGYNKWLDKDGLPGIAPPWGTLNAIDLNTGQYKWKIPFGDEPQLAEKGIYGTGTENYGGPLLLENGLLFIAASKDGYFRAYHTEDGTLVWKFKLPFAGFATPATYMVDGKQYIVIACGGSKLGTAKGNVYVAFSL